MLASDEDILLEAERWTRQGRAVAIATVVETWGSAPRPPGSHLIIDAAGEFLGSVSGGCVEGEVIAQAQEAIGLGHCRLLEFGVADETAWKVGLSCGGRISVFLRPLAPAIIAEINRARASRKSCALVSGLSSGTERVAAAGALAGDALAAELGARFAARASGLVAGREEPTFLSVFTPSPRIIAIGAVHISQALAPMATVAGFETIIVDPRTGFASSARFSGARLVADWPAEALKALALDAATAVALLTHEPRIDDEAARGALSSDCFYIGALGSRKTHARRLERLRADGFCESALARIHAPIGLDIGAKSPAEIAVAILGEIIEDLRREQRSGSSGKAA
ncbi:XdhC family protein [Methylocella silvestris]|uniref:XdhC/CoxI family protein n=1 Tax=Methylocella silvestris TaxID=199596 RepID=A0A2J7TKA5_METSI|nr:XdhC family protein [Methylocella silvestris]PNG27195.1 XdhC/CoxI family protein [Methylocella silvestris]